MGELAVTSIFGPHMYIMWGALRFSAHFVKPSALPDGLALPWPFDFTSTSQRTAQRILFKFGSFISCEGQCADKLLVIF